MECQVSGFSDPEEFMSKLQRLVYVSTATGKTDSLLNMATILAESQRNNARAGLTGVLAAHDGRYIQVIEGEEERLAALIARLARDDRHREIVILGQTLIVGRLFGGWTMANARITPVLGSMLSQLMGAPLPSPARITQLLLDAPVAR